MEERPNSRQEAIKENFKTVLGLAFHPLFEKPDRGQEEDKAIAKNPRQGGRFWDRRPRTAEAAAVCDSFATERMMFNSKI
ncbi:hypothetical protein ACVRXQ_08895 [Streptococcus panodentis]|uniref:Uncharacterized protein n=1 Tax=Streptococcus panodentis TaxID=1581472 RepID=A0ABS5AUY0_9STRE|nr:hypothetical protein [Streptococcus panodentis]MBP2620377.1 hypothetical protein [Streptococcus panodentis]